MRAIVTSLAFLLALWAPDAQAKDIHAGSLEIGAPWSRATPKGASVGAGYLTIKNTGTAPDRLIGGTSDVAEEIELHEMRMDNGIMRMRQVKGGLEIKPGETVEFKPGGAHLMLVGLKKPLKEGDHIKATLEFEKAGKVEVDFDVSGIGGPAHDMPGMKHDMPGMKM
jgi:copper(I)-binding protein